MRDALARDNDRGLDRSFGPRIEPAVPQRSAADVAGDTLATFEHAVDQVGFRLDAVEQAHRQNKVEQWHEERDRLNSALKAATRAHELVRSRAAAAGPEAIDRIEVAQRARAELEKRASALVEPPSGTTTVG